MKTLRQFLESAPKPALKAFHDYLCGKQSLVSNSRIVQECLERARDPEAIRSWIRSLESWKQEVLVWITVSQHRGLSLAEIASAVGQERTAALPEFLQEACLRLLLYREMRDSVAIYRAFAEHTEVLIPESEDFPAVNAWISVEDHLLWQLCQCISLILRGELRLTQTGELQRKSEQALRELFRDSARFPQMDADLWVLLLQFATHCGWLTIGESHQLETTPVVWTNLHHHPRRLIRQILDWWLEARFHSNPAVLRRLLPPHQNIRLTSLARRFWGYTPSERPVNLKKEGLSSAHLPRPLRELWLLGVIELDYSKDIHSAIRLTERGREWLWNEEPSQLQSGLQPASTPNFELLIPADSPPRYLLLASLMGETLSAETYIRVRLTREGFLRALDTDLPAAWIDSFLEWLRLPHSVSATIREWRQIRQGSALIRPLVLKIADPQRWKELDAYPPLRHIALESIPQWGFLLQPDKEAEARGILANFGLYPPESPKPRNAQPLTHGPWTAKFLIAYHPQGVIDYYLKAPDETATTSAVLASKTKYTTEFQTLVPAELLKVLRYALVMEIPVEIEYHNLENNAKKQPELITLLISRLHHRREPFYVEGLLPDGSALNIRLAQIQRIRLTRI